METNLDILAVPKAHPLATSGLLDNSPSESDDFPNSDGLFGAFPAMIDFSLIQGSAPGDRLIWTIN